MAPAIPEQPSRFQETKGENRVSHIEAQVFTSYSKYGSRDRLVFAGSTVPVILSPDLPIMSLLLSLQRAPQDHPAQRVYRPGLQHRRRRRWRRHFCFLHPGRRPSRPEWGVAKGRPDLIGETEARWGDGCCAKLKGRRGALVSAKKYLLR